MRIVSLVPSITEALCMLGLEDQVVGITDYCVHPQDVVDGKTRIGGTKDPDLAAIRALRPDLIFANTDEQRAQTLQELESLETDILVTETDSVDDVLDTWRKLGQATGREDAAEREHDRIVTARDEAQARARRRPPLQTLVPVWRSPWMAAGGATYVSDLLATCGFANVFAGSTEKWLRFALSTDPAEAGIVEKGPAKGQTVHVLPQRPDTVLLPSEPYAFAEADRDAFTALDVPREAVRLVDGELLTWWLSRTAAALDHFSGLHERLVPVVRRV